MKDKVSLLAVFLFIASGVGVQSAFADGNYSCDNLDAISGQHFLGKSYNVVVGADSETQIKDAMLFSRAVAPGAPTHELTLTSQDGQPDATYFSNGSTSFTLSDNGNTGALSLADGKVVLLCTRKLIGGGVTGSN